MKMQDGTAKFRVRDKNEDRVPTGIVQFFAGSSAPTGWLVCDGSAVSRTDYDELFGVIGTTYGAGDGSTTFNLPNLIDRFAEGGKSVGTKKSAGLPNITGDVGQQYTEGPLGGWHNYNDKGYGNGALQLKGSDYGYSCTWQKYPYTGIIAFDASKSNPIYGASDTVQPPALILLPIIKY